MAALLSLALLSLAPPAMSFAPPRAPSAAQSRDPPASRAAVVLLGSSSDENANGGAPRPPDDGLEQYSRCLSPVEARRSVRDESNRYSIIDSRKTLLGRIARGPARLLGRAVAGVAGRRGAKKPGSLILLRCGESEWTKTGRFTGWADPDLIREGVLEVEHAGRLLLSEGYEPDIVYTSLLKRAVKSVWAILNTLDSSYLPVYKSWRLNERSYGALTGLRKMDAAKELGYDVVQAWRNSHNARPPPMKETDEYYPGNDRRYDGLVEGGVPLTESLADCMERARPLWEYGISRKIEKGNTVLVVAHTNTLRGLMKVIDGISEEDIKEVSMPGGIPFVYKFDSNMRPLPPEEGKMSQAHTNGVFLEKPGLIQEALERTARWDRVVPGSFGQILPQIHRTTNLEDCLFKLKEEQSSAKKNEEVGVNPNDDGHLIVTNMANAPAENIEFGGGDADFEEFFEGNGDQTMDISMNVQKVSEESPGIVKQGTSNDPVVVFIRHGRTPHNVLGLFTGWEDPPLAPEGVEDARRAGRLLKMHGFEFDVVYTSWLQRAIETAWYCIDELDETWLPIVKSWRLNERMYGALTGQSKQMIANKYGEDQLKKWRRGFKVQPPAVSSYSLNYPGNDYRRAKQVRDLRISLSETINRSIEAREIQVHRKFPKAESLWNCVSISTILLSSACVTSHSLNVKMNRSIPFYTERIVPEAVQNGKRVLITSHENAIRGILMHLCDIPEEAMNQLHLPNGLPLVYNVRGKCITLLDDGTGKDPMDVHDFGPAAQYLFRPCEVDDDFWGEIETRGAEGEPKKREVVTA